MNRTYTVMYLLSVVVVLAVCFGYAFVWKFHTLYHPEAMAALPEMPDEKVFSKDTAALNQSCYLLLAYTFALSLCLLPLFFKLKLVPRGVSAQAADGS